MAYGGPSRQAGIPDPAHGSGAPGSGASASKGMAPILRGDYPRAHVRAVTLPEPAMTPPTDPAKPKAGFEAPEVADPNLINVFDYEREASARLVEGPLAYFTGGAMDERTMNDNRAAFGRRRIVPRVMTDVS